jgi:organic hydroperoxide reductase OsmC/OhrA
MSEPLSFTIVLEQEKTTRSASSSIGPGYPSCGSMNPSRSAAAAGPNAARLVAAAVANCLSASLLFCMRKFKQSPSRLRAEVNSELVRNERGRVRIGGFDVKIHLADEADSIGHFDRCLQQFEDFCVVTDSIRHGIPVRVTVLDSTGRQVYEAGEPVQAEIAGHC